MDTLVNIWMAKGGKPFLGERSDGLVALIETPIQSGAWFIVYPAVIFGTGYRSDGSTALLLGSEAIWVSL